MCYSRKEDTMVYINVETTSKAKLKGIKEAFEQYFKEVKVRGYEVDSQVPKQPINDDVFRGAENRLRALEEISEEYDYRVSCEGGLIRQYGRLFNTQIVLVEDKEGRVGFGMSPGFEIPSKYEEEALNSSIAELMDRVFEGKGGIRVLTEGLYTRESLVKAGTIMALTRLLNGEKW